MTPLGEQADRLRRWAFDDPAGRVAEAQQRLQELASEAEPGSRELHEIQGVGTQLARLADSLQ